MEKQEKDSKISNNEVLNDIISLTMARDNYLTKDSFFEKLGIKKEDVNEEELIDVMCFNALLSLQKSQIKLIEQLKWTVANISQVNYMISKEKEEKVGKR